MKRHKLLKTELGTYGDTVLGLLSFSVVVASMYWLIRVACGDLFKWLIGN